ncbi:ABC transporter substrate-binding protein [Halopiger aswanensis]|uniref:Iron complex transport system substrate-binding protein n=1 Tax=Halopiger aswanensis TaxID=148449 RepID=A0A3R7D9V3_9EURY|nr:ABC transporter substrate-binding protein [Halopiger aswanensis]RKD95061.1 iron complex transport system substrate-binding protein [Halopiger aswanensis]
MSDENDAAGTTRRDMVEYGGAILAGGLLAGCTGAESDSDAESTAAADGEDDAGDSSAYEVCMEPAGCLEFDEVPETYVTYKEAWAEMGVALGVGDRLAATDLGYGAVDRLNELFYEQLPGVSFPTAGDGVVDIRGGGDAVDKEVFYEIDADVHLMDPNLPRVYFDWSDDETAEIDQNVAPFFGNFIRRERDDAWGDDYEFYTLYEAFETVAKLFQREERYEAFATLHDEMLETIDARLPPEDERPAIGLLNGGSDPANGTFYVMDIADAGYEMKQYRDLGIKNAFEGAETGEHGKVDYETLLEYDPDQLFIHWGITHSESEFYETYVRPMEEGSTGQQLTAVQNDAVYPAGTAEQGPITNLFQTEMLARDQYPEEFGGEQLFDRQRVADIVTGDL